MAIVIGSTLSPKVNSAVAWASAEAPLFGVSETAAPGPFDIQWGNGQRGDTVPSTSVDEILAATGGTSTTKFLGQQVRITAQTLSGYGRWRCIQVYNRGGSDVCLLQNEWNAYQEQPPANLTIIP